MKTYNYNLAMNKALEFLKKDKVMKRLVETYTEEIKLQENYNHFVDLVETIIYQQISYKAAKTIFERFTQLFKDQKPTSNKLLKLSEEELANAGISRQKRGYLYSLAEKFQDGTVKPEKYEKLSDNEIIDELVQIKGIGKWSAQMFLLFNLGREDIFAPDDLGLRKGIQKQYKLEELPKPKEAEKFAERWKPYRSYASVLLWRSVRNE
ncbi:MAG: DNA-3-methyladenine glycosylase 2 family protein [Asgard group archaeon]|nr:DNA-3-methyladenine glycosylase 2 family protein [Asgard group archaeon]